MQMAGLWVLLTFLQSMTVSGGTVFYGGGSYIGLSAGYPKALPGDCSTRTRAVWTAAGIPPSQDFLEVAPSAAVEGGFCRPDTLPESDTFTRPSS